MKFLHKDLGHCKGGEIVEVTLSGSAANVQLLDSSNYSNYKAGRRYRYQGGHVKRSPVRLSVPRAGHWHVVIDTGGYGGTIRAGIRLLPGALPPLRETPLSNIPSLVRDAPPAVSNDISTFDVFISHATEDKDSLVRPLAEALREGGLDVWYDEYEMRIGDSLRRKIDHGLANSRFGIVVLSSSFFNKGWPNYELDGIVTKSVSDEQVLLPIWHNITKDEVVGYSPSLADKVARSTATHTVQEIAQEIIDVVTSSASTM